MMCAMRNIALVVAIALAGCGSKKDAKDQPGPTAGSTVVPPGGGSGHWTRVNGRITNAEGAELCTALLPATLREGYEATGGGTDTELTCNLKAAGKPLRSATMSCAPGQTVDAFRAAHPGTALPGLGRAAVTDATGPVFFATNADCVVTIHDFDKAADPVAFAQAIDGVLTKANTPWPPR